MYASHGQSAVSLFQRLFQFAAGACRALSRPALHADAFLARSSSSRSCSRSTGMSPTIWASRTSASCIAYLRRHRGGGWSRSSGAKAATRCRDRARRGRSVRLCRRWPISSGSELFAIYRYILLSRDAGAASDHRRGRPFAAPAPQPLRYPGRASPPAVLLSPAAISSSARRWTTPMSRPRCRRSPIPTTPWC